MTKKGSISAAELMEQLNADPDYQERKAAKVTQIEKLEETCAKDEAGLVSELNKLGLVVSSVWDLVNNAPHPVLDRNFTGSYEIVYPVLVKHLKENHHQRIREGIIRALSEKGAKQCAAEPLLEELSKEPVQSNRWVIANALKVMLSRSELHEHPEVEQAYGKGYL